MLADLTRALGHPATSVLAQELLGTADREILAYATDHLLTVVTTNRTDFKRLHKTVPDHGGIIVVTQPNPGDYEALASAIVAGLDSLDGELVGRLFRIDWRARGPLVEL